MPFNTRASDEDLARRFVAYTPPDARLETPHTEVFQVIRDAVAVLDAKLPPGADKDYVVKKMEQALFVARLAIHKNAQAVIDDRR